MLAAIIVNIVPHPVWPDYKRPRREEYASPEEHVNDFIAEQEAATAEKTAAAKQRKRKRRQVESIVTLWFLDED